MGLKIERRENICFFFLWGRKVKLVIVKPCVLVRVGCVCRGVKPSDEEHIHIYISVWFVQPSIAR